MLKLLSDDEVMHGLIQNSYRNFHAKGLDYVCVRRNHDLTVKFYFFDEDCVEAGEIVFPHNHRYDFATTVLAGGLWNKTWVETRYSDAPPFNRFHYRTPLNGGGGFTWDREVKLRGLDCTPYEAGTRYLCPFDAIHTLAQVQRGTVLMLWQYRDTMPVGKPTFAYARSNEPPSLDGLYDKHTPDQIIARLRQIETLSPGICGEHALAKLLSLKEDA